MKMRLIVALAVSSLAATAHSETNLVISSFSRNGALSWSNCPGAIQYSVEWAPAPDGTWTNSWASLNAISATSSTYTVPVPMFYRLVAMYPDYARLLLHGDGTNGAVSFPDAAGSHAVVAFGDTDVSTNQSKFGSAAYFDGNGSYLETADSPDFDPGDQAFTIDFWMFPLDDVGWSFLISKSVPNGGQGYDLRFQANGIIVVGVNGWAGNIYSDASVATGVWSHIALSSTTNTVYLFVNGLQKGTCPRSSITDTGIPLRVGWAGSNVGAVLYHGYMDEIRFSLGIARWTNNFSVPTSPYVDD